MSSAINNSDRRRVNGRPVTEAFADFWDTAKEYTDGWNTDQNRLQKDQQGHAAVHIVHKPEVISAPDLVRQVTAKMVEKFGPQSLWPDVIANVHPLNGCYLLCFRDALIMLRQRDTFISYQYGLLVKRDSYVNPT